MQTPLKGTKKQVTTAEKIRSGADLDQLQEDVLVDLEGGFRTQLRKESARDMVRVARVFRKLKRVDSAAWWIEHRNRFRQRSAYYHGEVWEFLREQFGSRRFCGEPTDEPLPVPSRVAEAVAAFVRKLEFRTEPNGANLRLIDGMPVDLACIVEAEATHVGLVHLGDLRLLVRDIDHARSVIELAGGCADADAHSHLLTLASSQDDGKHVVAAYSPGDEQAVVYRVDVGEESIVAESVEQWLRAVLETAEEGSDAEAIGKLMGVLLVEPPSLELVPIELRLVRREGDQLRELQRFASADVSTCPTKTLAVLGGRLVFTPNDDHPDRRWTAVAVFKDGSIGLAARIPEVFTEVRERADGAVLARSEASFFEVAGARELISG